MKKAVIIFFFAVISVLCISCGKDTKQSRNVLYFAKVYCPETYDKLNGNTYIRLFDDSYLQVHRVREADFAEGKEEYESSYTKKLDAQKFKEILETINALEDCRAETQVQDGARCAYVTSFSNSKRYEFHLGSDVNVWHSFVVDELLKATNIFDK